MNRVAVLGSTGSIGTQTLEIARLLASHVSIVAVAGGANTSLLSAQIAEFEPRLFFSQHPQSVNGGTARYASLEEIATDESVDTVVVATAGSAGLRAGLAALRSEKRVALANKEALVMTGSLMMEAARTPGSLLVPVDSEHSALWQCLQGEDSNEVARLLLTASGGPFYSYSVEELDGVTPAAALAHPVWSMGRKITIDSATLMNKGLEIIEAHWLFRVPYSRIDVLIHPQCIVHSMVEFADGSTKAQLGVPNMLLPIQYALTWPHRVPGPAPLMDWSDIRSLNFDPVDAERFPALRIAREAGEQGGTVPAALCGADEAAVDLFLEGTVGFSQIPGLVERAVQAHVRCEANSIEAVLEAEEWGRRYVRTTVSESRSGTGRPR
ncbi:1-deoxy-D-xylulose-5-phosphate reductoisomerase [Chloroflexota bacterium]